MQTRALASAEPVRECIFQTSPTISRLVPVQNCSAEHYSEHRPNLNLDGLKIKGQNYENVACLAYHAHG